MTKTLVAEDRIVDAIVTVRGKRVVIASDLATLYGTTTKRLNEQVRRNRDRFPADFCFKLTVASVTRWSQIATTFRR